MATFTPPVATKVIPRIFMDAEGRPVKTSRLQKGLYKYMRPLDRAVNVYVLSDGSVVTDISVPIVGGQSSTAIPYPLTFLGGITAGTIAGPPEGAEGGPYGPPPPYAYVQDNVQVDPGSTPNRSGGSFTEYRLPVYVKYYFLGAHGPYPNLSANLISLLTAAGFAAYLS